MKQSAWRVPLLLFAGSILLQMAWIVAVPPFRGIDEFDHAYHAAAVARGQWAGPYVAAQHGRGDLVRVPRDIVAAATAECQTYKYVGHDNCRPVAHLGNGMVSVASAAARYNPAFYWILGTAARPFAGAEALYVMRICAAVMCSAMLATAGAALQRWRRPRVAVASLLAAVTPMAVYSTAMPAPNGLEMNAGLAVWACLLGLREADARWQRILLRLGAPAAIILATVRSLGPLWLVLIVLTCAFVVGRKRLVEAVSRNRHDMLAVSFLVLLSTVAGVAWTLTQGTNNPGAEPFHRAQHVLLRSLEQIPLWLFQAMGAFPTRNERAPGLLYAVFLMVFVAVAALALWRGDTRNRAAFLITCLGTYGIPLTLTILTFSHGGATWQGRYTLPYSMGIPLLAAAALTSKPVRSRLTGPLLLAGWLCVAIAHDVGVVSVLRLERTSSPLSGTAEWPIPPVWLLVALTVGGLVMWGLAARDALVSSELKAADENSLPERQRMPAAILAKSNPVGEETIA